MGWGGLEVMVSAPSWCCFFTRQLHLRNDRAQVLSENRIPLQNWHRSTPSPLQCNSAQFSPWGSTGTEAAEETSCPLLHRQKPLLKRSRCSCDYLSHPSRRGEKNQPEWRTGSSGGKKEGEQDKMKISGDNQAGRRVQEAKAF